MPGEAPGGRDIHDFQAAFGAMDPEFTLPKRWFFNFQGMAEKGSRKYISGEGSERYISKEGSERRDMLKVSDHLSGNLRRGQSKYFSTYKNWIQRPAMAADHLQSDLCSKAHKELRVRPRSRLPKGLQEKPKKATYEIYREQENVLRHPGVEKLFEADMMPSSIVLGDPKQTT